MKLLYYSPASYGGIADYAHEQANALVSLGVDVTFLCTPNYPIGRGKKYKMMPILQDLTPNQTFPHKALKAIHYIATMLTNFSKLANFIEANHFQYVLLGSYVEYFAPIWSGSLKKLAKKGVIFGAIVHDPVRDFVVGPHWWHRWSIACGYSFLREAFVHETIELDTVWSMPQLRTTVIPYGIHQFPSANKSRKEIRTSLNLPLDAKVMLSFGYIRNNKNLDLVIRAMVNFPQVYLIVAGQEQSSSQRPIAFYQDLAQTLGVGDRCRWEVRFIPEAEVGNLFIAADIIVLTYSYTFRSASSALSTAANYRKICIASAGEGSLRSVIQKYELGIWVEPDDLVSLVKGIQIWLNSPPQPNWEKYIAVNSWLINAQSVMNCFKYV
ncbi:MAG: glycosyltransferase family 4 protein [Coleofasciculus sp. A1-SPW-01]|uniref:glycosyltransferase family 4 protein n=1 Tax=Coleofasciculus sp. A1-SPW-01 TaxID=3070819 RepID=UPI0032FCA3D4